MSFAMKLYKTRTRYTVTVVLVVHQCRQCAQRINSQCPTSIVL